LFVYDRGFQWLFVDGIRERERFLAELTRCSAPSSCPSGKSDCIRLVRLRVLEGLDGNTKRSATLPILAWSTIFSSSLVCIGGCSRSYMYIYMDPLPFDSQTVWRILCFIYSGTYQDEDKDMTFPKVQFPVSDFCHSRLPWRPLEDLQLPAVDSEQLPCRTLSSITPPTKALPALLRRSSLLPATSTRRDPRS
jgi:hypothetical protein